MNGVRHTRFSPDWIGHIQVHYLTPCPKKFEVISNAEDRRDVCIHRRDDEGVVARLVNGTWRPMVGGDMQRMESLREQAKEIALVTGQKITLVKFSTRTELEVIEP